MSVAARQNRDMPSTELGSALRAWRDRVSPASAGISTVGRRRARGLRREEVAHLAGVSADYLVRLEQGRAQNPSASVVQALARALRLDDTERDHLFHLAGHAAPTTGAIDTHVTPSVLRLVDRLGNTPVTVIDAAWNTVLQNQAADAVFGPVPPSGRERNRAWRTFMTPFDASNLEPQTRSMVERDIVADLHVTVQLYPDDASVASLVADLRRDSARFAELWETTPPRMRGSQRKVLDHPVAGRMTIDCDVLEVRGSDLQIVVFSAEPGTPDADALDLAVVVGLQDLTPSR